jgi:hypothetical protein
MYNNTFYQAQTATPKLNAFHVDNGNAGGVWDFYNNVVYGPFGYEIGNNEVGAVGMVNVLGSWIGQFDFNYYGNNSNGMTFGWSFTGSSNQAQPLSSWLAHLSNAADAHSTLGGNPFSGTPAEGVSASFALTGACLTAGIGGAACGANDGTGPIGCNF